MTVSMGLFSDIRKAQSMSTNDTQILPAQRIETLVADPGTGEQRHRTDYAGTLWFGGLPEIVGDNILPGASVHINAPVWLPDSHRYTVEDVQVQVSGAVQGGQATSLGGNHQLLEIGATLAEHPQAGGALCLCLNITALATLPFGVAYRVIAVSVPGAVEQR